MVEANYKILSLNDWVQLGHLVDEALDDMFQTKEGSPESERQSKIWESVSKIVIDVPDPRQVPHDIARTAWSFLQHAALQLQLRANAVPDSPKELLEGTGEVD